MKTQLCLGSRASGLALLLLLLTINYPLSTHAQGTAFTYQGRLNDGNAAANGLYDVAFSLFGAGTGGIPVGGPVTNTATIVSNGLFTVALDFGASVFNGSDRWLEIAVRTNGTPGAFTTLNPRQQITPAPYAITASNISGTVSGASLAGAYSNAITLNNLGNSFNGSGAGLTSLNASSLASGAVPSAALANAWKTTGNGGTVGGSNFIGTADNQPLELKVNGVRAFRLQPSLDTPNIIGGASVNYAVAGVQGATIAGGGSVATYGFPYANWIADFHGTIGGGLGNSIQTNGYEATISGGNQNTTLGARSAIGGGYGNTITSLGISSVIGGGFGNYQGAAYTVIAGGYENSNFGSGGSVLGGEFNNIQSGASYACMSGGYQNTITSAGSASVIGGGASNNNAAPYAAIVGGYGNRNSGDHSAISGGGFNDIAGSGLFSVYSTIGGGLRNTIQIDTTFSVIGGGQTNTILADSAYGAIGGGASNVVFGSFGTVPGGDQNTANSSALAAGHRAKANHAGTFVWADSQNADFSSTLANQFSIRASGGVRLQTSGAGLTLDGPETISSGDANQLILKNSSDGRSWYLYDEIYNNSGNLIFLPSSPGVGAYISRANGSIYSLSDGRIKRDITPLHDVLGRVLRLRPVSYRFQSALQGSPPTFGLIAQEVEPLFPEVVGDLAGTKSLAYNQLVPVVIGAIEELNQKMDSENTALRNELKRRDAENAELKQRLEALEKFVHHDR